jgi:clan AA aspartic protease
MEDQVNDMGLVFAEIELLRGGDVILAEEGFIQSDQIRRCTVNALVDSGATMLAIPLFVQQQLNLKPRRQIEAELADGSSSNYEVVGPVEVRFQNRQTFVDALVVPNSTQVLLGAIPMEGMDVLIDPKRERLIVNPESPDVARMLLM